jgi:hypothetical protein
MAGGPVLTDAMATSCSTASAARVWVVVKIGLALWLLNFLVTFVNVWPTPMVRPEARIGTEFVGIWVAVLLLYGLRGRVGQIGVGVVTALFAILAFGRYIDVTVPAWLGRKVNVYWDAYHLPKFLEVASQSLSAWQVVGVIAAVIGGLALLIWVIRVAVVIMAREAAPRAWRSPLAWILTLACTALVVADRMGLPAASPYVAGPVSPVYQRQAELLYAAWMPGQADQGLPPSPSLDYDLALLGGAEVRVIFVESYGATTYRRPEIAEVVDPARARLAEVAAGQGLGVVSALVTAATFGGASDLSHLSLLSGVDLSNPRHHDLLLLSDRETLLDTFERAGYRTVGLYPAMSWEWPERAFYDFDHYLDGPALDYRGPKFGLWWLPDQFAMARVDELLTPGVDDPPRLIFFPTINSHIPYRPTPPYQPDWSKVTSDEPFPAVETARALADEIDWNDLFSGYLSTIEYTFQWLGGYLQQPRPRDTVLVLVGDHQPAGGITRPNANWDVPVHVLTNNDAILDRLRAHGFRDGMRPADTTLGHLADLTVMLLGAFSSDDPAGGSGPAVAVAE